MSIFSVILFTAILIAVPYLILKYLAAPLAPSGSKNLLFGATIAAGVILLIVFIIAGAIPRTSARLIGKTIETVETQINEISPGYTDTVLDKESLEAFLENGQMINDSVSADPRISMILDATGTKVFSKYLGNFIDDIDGTLAEFDTAGTPFTLHNIFISLQEMAVPLIITSTKVLQVVIIVIALIIFGGIALIATGMRKNWFSANNSSLNFGDNA